MELMVEAAERGWIPDPLMRVGIRRLLRQRLRQEDPGNEASREAALARLTETMRSSPVALYTGEANRQHYEVPAAFYRLVLGPRLKYSSCLFEAGVDDLAFAEEAMLDRTCARAGIREGMRVLDLGCGWGSLSLWVAEKYPGCRVTSVSNSASQRAHIEAECQRKGFENVRCVTADVNAYAPEGPAFDRVVSVEMFEHVRNWERLLSRLQGWLSPEGRLFLHVFCHRRWAWFFEQDGESDWMARHFFTGGLMPSLDLPERLRVPFAVEDRWEVDGRHYEKTLRAWLANLDARRPEVLETLRGEGGSRIDPAVAERRLHRWRLFLLACAELFGWKEGEEWLVSHTLLRPEGPA